MSKYLLYTKDSLLKERYESFFENDEIVFAENKNEIKESIGCDIIIVDEALITVKEYIEDSKIFTKYKKPIVYLVENDGINLLPLLDNGVISILLKNSDRDSVRKKFENIIYNYRYLKKMELMSKKSKRTEKFFELFNSITSDNSINDIMVSILESIQGTFGFKSIEFFFVMNGILKHKLSIGKNDKDYSDMKWRLDKKTPKWIKTIMKLNKPITIAKKQNTPLKEVFCNSSVIIPLKIKEKFIGLIAAETISEKSVLDKHDMKLLKAYGDQTSVVLENAQLYWNVITAREELIKQEKKNLLGQMIVSLNHEINNPLSIISMEAQLLQKKFENKESKIESRIANIENNIERIKLILEKISSLNVNKEIGIEYIKGQEMLNLELEN